MNSLKDPSLSSDGSFERVWGFFEEQKLYSESYWSETDVGKEKASSLNSN